MEGVNARISVKERKRELDVERERDGARVLHFAVFYLYLRHTTAHGNKDPRRNRGEALGKWGVCVCICAACNVEMNDS